MNPKAPYNSGDLHNMVEKVRTYCAKTIPLVFNNTLSYYESICAFSAKVNQLCDAVNSQSLAICEFTHMVEIELEKFESYIQTKYNELRDDVNDLDTRTGALETTVAVYNTRIGTLETTVADMREQLTSMLEDINVMSGDISNLEGDVHNLEIEVGQKVDYTDVINQVLENSDKIPTSGAVYDAIAQGGGGGTFVPDATTTSKGIVQVGENLNVNNGVLSIPNATSASKGVVQVGPNLDVNNGVIDVPRATGIDMGIVMPGVGINISSVQPGVMNLATATDQRIGGVKAGDSLSVENDGTLNVDHATTSDYGTVKIGDNLETDSNGALKVKDAEAGTVKGAVTIDSMTSNLELTNGVLDVPTGTKNNKGVLQVGDNLSVNGGVVDVPTASTVGKGVMTIDGTNPQANPLKLTSGVLSLDIGNNLEVVNGELNAKKADDTLGDYGVVAPKLNGGIKATDGEIELKQATAQTIGGVFIGNTFGTQQTGTVPTCAGVYDNFATKSTENFAVRADAPNLDGDCQLYKIDAQGVRTNLTPVTQGGGGGTVPDATTTSKGIVQIGDNIEVANGVISVPEAGANTSGVIKVNNATPLYMNTQTNTINIKDGSTTEKGAVQVGNNINVNNGVISVPTANGSTSYGVVRLGNNSNLSMGNDGIIDAPTGTKNNKGVLQVGDNIDVSAGEISVPKATSSSLGVVQPGSRLTVDSSGVLNVPTADNNDHYGVVKVPSSSNLTCNSVGELDVFTGTKSNKGILQVGTNLSVSSGVVDVPIASSSDLGVIKPGANTSVDANGLLSVPSATDTTKGVIAYDTRHLEITSSDKLNVKTTSSVTGGTSYDIPTASAITQYTNSLMTSSVTSGDTTHVPTSDAVYQAVQGAGLPFNILVPKLPSEATVNDDIFISPGSAASAVYSSYKTTPIGFYLWGNQVTLFIAIKKSLFPSAITSVYEAAGYVNILVSRRTVSTTISPGDGVVKPTASTNTNYFVFAVQCTGDMDTTNGANSIMVIMPK